MGHPNLIESEEELADIVRSMRTVAVVGIKDERRADQPAHEIPRMLAARGIDVIPVNPTIASALGKPSLPSVTELDRAVDLVNVFRRSEAIPEPTSSCRCLPSDGPQRYGYSPVSATTLQRPDWRKRACGSFKTAVSGSTSRATAAADQSRLLASSASGLRSPFSRLMWA